MSSPFATLCFVLLVFLASHCRLAEERLLGEELGQMPSQPMALELEFDPQETIGDASGDYRIVDTGPSSDWYLGQPETNYALQFDRAGQFLRIADSGARPLDFEIGDAITIEAWVRIDRLTGDSPVYLVGKGRTYEDGPRENHNYALRVSKSGSGAKISFLFSTGQEGELRYHRWTSNANFAIDSSWHHVAVTYQFGEPKSIRGFLDGKSSGGKWDMGGPTTLPPTVDDDALWIGSSRGGEPGNSLVGALDSIRIHRAIVSADELKSRRRVIERAPSWPETADDARVTVTLHESSHGGAAMSHAEFPMLASAESLRLTLPKLALHRLPLKYLPGGIRELWSGPVLLRAFAKVHLPQGDIDFLVRSPGRSRLWLDGEIVANTPARRLFPDAHQPFEIYEPDMDWLRVPFVGTREERVTVAGDGQVHELIFESLVGSSNSRCELGETMVALRQGDAMFTLVSPVADVSQPGGAPVHLVDAEYLEYEREIESQLARMDHQVLVEEAAKEEAFWQQRHAAARAAIEHQPAAKHYDTLDEVVAAETPDAGESSISDLQFLRRLTLDTIGVPPSLEEIEFYESLPATSRRITATERLLADPRWADHWTSYWQDVLAENPCILKPSLNNTGPFRYWIHDALILNKPMDRFVTELIRMEGGKLGGGPAGFGMATQNDVPMAEKAHIIASAFLGVDMKCARCHDAPYHPWSQRDLFSIGAMLNQAAIKVPETSSVPAAFFDRKGDDSAIAVTLAPGELVQPRWPSEKLDSEVFGVAEVKTPGKVPAELLRREGDSRELLAALITRGENQRFAETLVNRVWTRLMGWGLTTSTDDWYGAKVRYPETLRFLSRELILSGYDLKRLNQIILQSEIYARKALDETRVERGQAYSAPWIRKLSAEQLVDSMHSVAGIPLQTEAVTFDPEASQKLENFLNLGVAHRAWQLASLSNERDRPSLSLPKAAAVVDCLQAFGWRASRQAPTTHRETEANVVQPGVVANGHVTTWVTRLTDDSMMTKLAIDAQQPRQLVDQLFLAALTRLPNAEESAAFVSQLETGFADRVTPPSRTKPQPPRSRGFATWSNHFAVGANQLMREIEMEVAAGPKPTERLSVDWRERAEDAVWALINSPEFQRVP